MGIGDFAKDRIIPDCIRAALSGSDIVVRNPYSIRPYQHVLEPVYAYLMILAAQFHDAGISGYYNVGPDECDCYSTGDLVNTFIECWDGDIKRVDQSDGGPHEAGFLKLDCAKLKSVFDWNPKWNLKTAIIKTVEWTKCYRDGNDIRKCMDFQIDEFIKA